MRSERRRPASPLRPLVLPVYLPAVIYAVGTGAINPVLVLVALDIGFSESGSSAVLGVFGMIAVVASPFLGRFITRVGDRAALLSAGVVTTLALLVSLASLAVGDEYRGFAQVAFVVSLVFIALGASIWQLGRQAYVAESVGPEWRARGMSALGGMSRIGQLVGPALSTVLIAIWFLGSVFWLALVMTVISTVMVVVFLVPRDLPTGDAGAGAQAASTQAAVARGVDAKAARTAAAVGGDDAAAGKSTTTRRAQRAPKQEKRRTPVVRSWYTTTVMGVGLNALGVVRANRNVIVPLWGTFIGVDDHVIAATFAASALVDTVMFLVAGGIMDRFGRMGAIIPSLTIMPAGIVIMLAWPTLTGFVVGASVLGFGNGFGAGIVMTVGADLSPDERRADFLGLWQSIVTAGNAAGPFIASGMTALLGVAASLWATAGIGVAGLAWLAALIAPAYARLGIDTRGRPLVREQQRAEASA